MKPNEWRESVRRSFGIVLDFQRRPEYFDTRVWLLRKMEIKGDCWVSCTGWARIGDQRRSVRSASYALFVGPLPRGKTTSVGTTCGNPRCICPDHLVLSVKQD